MRKYIAQFTSKTKCSTILSNDIYLTENGVNVFKIRIKEAFNRDLPHIKIVDNGNYMVFDSDFFIHFVEYVEPDFIDQMNEIIDFTFSNNGFDSSCFNVVLKNI